MENWNEKVRISAEGIKCGADWFLWIAGLSLVNMAISWFGGGISFIFGLGMSQLVDAYGQAFAQDMGYIATAIAIALNLLISLFFYFIYKKSGNGKKWAFIVGMVVYLLDGLLFLMVSDYWSLAFHGYALFRIFNGFLQCIEFAKLQANHGDENLTVSEDLLEESEEQRA